MERALVTSLYRDESSRETVMVMEATESKQKIRVKIPCQRANILALEAHGLNDRCSLYSIMSQCVGELGAAFGSVVITKEEPGPVSGVISISRSGHTTWIAADVVELVAFAMHARIPIYVRRSETSQSSRQGPPPDRSQLPDVFEDALADILSSDTDESTTVGAPE